MKTQNRNQSKQNRKERMIVSSQELRSKIPIYNIMRNDNIVEINSKDPGLENLSKASDGTNSKGTLMLLEMGHVNARLKKSSELPDVDIV